MAAVALKSAKRARWISTGTASRLLDISHARVRRLARRGLIRSRQLAPGLAVEVHAGDVRALRQRFDVG